MHLRIFSKENLMADILLTGGKLLSPVLNSEWQILMGEFKKSGIQGFKDEHIDNTYTIVSSIFRPEDPGFEPAFRDAVRDTGYEVVEVNDKVELEIMEILAKYPEDESKTEILNKLQRMHKLEQEILLIRLKAFEEDPGKEEKFLAELRTLKGKIESEHQ